MAIEIVSFPMKNGGSFHSYGIVYQRVNGGFLKWVIPKMIVSVSILNIVLVGGLEHLLFFYIMRIIIPTDELIFFRGSETTNQ